MRCEKQSQTTPYGIDPLLAPEMMLPLPIHEYEKSEVPTVKIFEKRYGDSYEKSFTGVPSPCPLGPSGRRGKGEELPVSYQRTMLTSFAYSLR